MTKRLRYLDVSATALMALLTHECDGESILSHDAPPDLTLEAIVQQTPYLYRLYVSSETFAEVGDDEAFPMLLITTRKTERIGPQDLI